MFDYVSQPLFKAMEVFFPINAFLLGVDLFQNYLNAGKRLIIRAHFFKNVL
jgi:hypothetical protein